MKSWVRLCVWLLAVGCCLLGGLAFAHPACTKDCESAEEHFRNALAMRTEAGNLRVLMEKEKLYQNAIALCPDFTAAHNNLGDVYENLGKYTEAIYEYQKAISLDGNFSAPYSGLGDVYFKNGNYTEAVKQYDKALELDPKDEVTRDLRMQAQALMQSDVIPKDAIVKVLARPQILTRGPVDVVKISFGSDLHKGSIPFDYNQYVIREDAKAQLREIGQALTTAELSDYVFEIGGHTDIRGSEDFNLELSLKRANAVKDHLVNDYRIPAKRLTVKGYGKSRLIAMGNDEACHALNRRVDLTRLGKGGDTSIERDSAAGRGRIDVDLGFLYGDGSTVKRSQISPDGRTVLRAGKDLYQVFFRSRQSCYIYVLQKDATGKWYVLFPQKESTYNSNPVKAERDYWLPGFDNGFSMDENRGQQTLYLFASLREMRDLESAQLDLEQAVGPIARGFQTRGLSHIGKPEVLIPSTPQVAKKATAEHAKKPTGVGVYPSAATHNDFANIVNYLESEGALVRTVSFLHQ